MLVMAKETAEVASRVAWLAVVIAEALLVGFRELIFWVTHCHKLSSERLRRAIIATVTINVLEFLGILLDAHVETRQRILSVILAHVLVVTCSAEHLLLVALDTCR